MALPSSGQISLNQVNVELGLSGTAQISMNQSTVRTLFGKSSGQIAMSDGWGKSNCPAYGTLLYSYCMGANLYSVYANGSCGTYTQLAIECATWACPGECL